ncbi:asparaginase [Cellulosimicrobium funkei]|uniref:Asparaginase n=1 Tax=Cellulosimicrobium funkei TaxID=264251 RepID=A0A0H2KNX1_9MICO|nr:asparaginase [Cellulosimicrobium funkei]KLN35241.1 asparaginase [Cellulosimicrobium funkei]
MTAHVQGGIERAAVPLAEVVRGDLVESVHAGHLVLLGDGGEPVLERGDADAVIWPRSSVKPFQAVAMLRHGLALPPRLLALAAASHNGEPEHLAGVREILEGVGLDESALRNTPDMPLHPPAAFAWQLEGHGPSSLTQNCSGKHAAMLATCVAAGWDTATYLDVDHPLQVAVRETVAEATGVPVEHVTVDGCGAPLFSTTVRGLARAFGHLAAAPERDPLSPAAQVARAMSTFPEMVGGTGRDATLAMRAVPGLVAKDGADGVYGAGLPDGSALAFKVLDGASRPRPAVLAAALRRLGAQDVTGADDAALAMLGDVPVLGAGRPVGAVRPVLDGATAVPSGDAERRS